MSNIFIDWPLFSPKSNGIICLYELSSYLHNSGFSVFGVPRNFRAFMRTRNRLPAKYRDIATAEKPFGSSSDFFIVAETVSKKNIMKARIHAIQIVWWPLAPYCLLDGTLWPRVGDLSLPYSSYIDPDSSQYFYFQPELDIHFKNALAHQKTRNIGNAPRICIYNGKGRIKDLPRPVLDLCKVSEVVLITRTSPSTRLELFNLLSSADGLITFDEFSAINLESAALGIPVFLANPLFPSVCKHTFSIPNLQDRVVSDASNFLNLVSMRRHNKLDSWEPDDLTSLNKQTLYSWQSLLSSPESFEKYRVDNACINRFRAYTQLLQSKRVISINNRGQAGGVWLASQFISNTSRGIASPTLKLLILIFDYLYIYFSPALLLPERFPLIKKLVAKLCSKKRICSYMNGVRSFY